MENESAQLQTNQNPLLDNIGKTINPYLEMLKGFQNDMVKASGNPLTFVAKAISDKFIYDPKTKRILPSSLFYPENRDPFNMVMAMSSGPVEVGASKAAPSIIKGTEEMIETPKYTSTAKGKTFFNPITRKVELQLPSGSQAGGTSMIIPRENVHNTIIEAEQNIANKVPGWEKEVGRVERAKAYLAKHYKETGVPTQTAKTIVSQDPTINMKRDIVIKDVHGQKATLPAGEAYTPYVTDKGQIVLKDSDQFTINKNQYQNVRGNAIAGGQAQEFAPELKGTTEIIRSDELVPKPFEGWSDQDIMIHYHDLTGKSARGKTIDQIKREIIEMESADPDLLAAHRGASGGPLFKQYTLPGGKNYREILIQAPEIKELPKDYFITKDSAGPNLYHVQGPGGTFISFRSDNPANVNERALSAFNSQSPKFIGAHWSEPNVLAHIRMNDRITPDGKKVAFMEELQSDWGREARKEGIKGPEYQVLQQRLNQIERKQSEMLYDATHGVKSPNEEFEFDELTREKEGIISELSTMEQKVPGHPLLKDWQTLAVKRGLQDAAQNGSEYFAWTTGAQQQARYNLSKQIERIDWGLSSKYAASNGVDKVVNIIPKTEDPIGLFIDKNGIILESAEAPAEWIGKKINDVVGKGIAEKITGNESGKLAQEGLNIGGEWANNLYDKQVKDLVEKITGGKVENIDVGAGKLMMSYEELPENIRKIVDKVEKGTLNVSKLDSKLKPLGYTADYGMDGEITEIYKLGGTSQQAIRLTPEIRAKILGQEIPVKQPSGQQPVGYIYDPKLKKVIAK